MWITYRAGPSFKQRGAPGDTHAPCTGDKAMCHAAYIKASKQQKFMKCVASHVVGVEKKCYELTQKVQCG